MSARDGLRGVRGLEQIATTVRLFAVVGSGTTFLMFAYLVAERPAGYGLPDAAPIYAGGSAASALFTIAMGWGRRRPVEIWLERVLMILRWQVACGVLLVFTVATGVRVQLLVPVGLYGAFLLFAFVLFSVLSLTAVTLRHEYAVRARVEEEARRVAEMRVLLATLSRRKPWWARRSAVPVAYPLDAATPAPVRRGRRRSGER